MRMISPEVKAPKTCIARNQAEYRVLTVARVSHPLYGVEEGRDHNSLLMAYRPTDDERRRIAAGEDIYISLLTGGTSMQPILVLTGKEEAAGAFGLEVET
jgi:hypothetical protein